MSLLALQNSVTMQNKLYASVLLAILLVSGTRAATKIVLTNDDGWAVAQLRAEYTALTAVGYSVSTNHCCPQKFAKCYELLTQFIFIGPPVGSRRQQIWKRLFDYDSYGSDYRVPI